ncbi:MAG: beta-N-acetylhexosaminidase [Clostridia bacterium]|nr:beta-N-acetylhexosaminidase [Clostridia bacterium]
MKLESFGVMIDASRNAVMTLDGYKRFLPVLKKMGYNTVFLYCEDTYEVDGEPYFGYMRGKYTKEEMKSIDAYANSIGIEIIPCIQTLAHLETIFKWNKYPNDTHEVLLVDDDRTYELIDNMFATLRECFSTKRLHAGMDEAWLLGRGKHTDIYGYEETDTMMTRHLDRVSKLAEKHGYEIMVWSDMFFRPWCNGTYPSTRVTVPEEYKAAIPKSVLPVYWNYYTRDEQVYFDVLDNHKQLSDSPWFAGGAWTWGGFMPHNKFSLESMIPALRASKKQNINNFFLTMWGDNGGECSRFSVLPTLFYLSEINRGNQDEDKIKAKFERTFGISFDEFMLLDSPNDLYPNKDKVDHPINPSKYMLYSDLFCGFLDYTVTKGGGELYAEKAEKLRAVAKKSRKFGYLFNTGATLCDVLAVKYELGVKTREAYKSGDKAELIRLAKEDYTKLVLRIKAFRRAFLHQWTLENKYCGFDVQDYRLGGLVARVEACKKRLIDYAAGRLGSIEELECEILPYGPGDAGKSIYYNNFRESATSNPF